MQEKERAFGGQESELLRQSVRDSTGERTTELSTNNVRGILLSHVERVGRGRPHPLTVGTSVSQIRANLCISTLKCLG